MTRLCTAFGALALTVASIGAVHAQSPESPFGRDSASVTYGPYLRAELGLANLDPDQGTWLPPGAPRDPRIFFDTDVDNGTVGAIAFGFDWQNGRRAEFALNMFGREDFAAPCASASDGSSCATHADITGGSVRTRAAMINGYFAPREARGVNSRFQPFLTAGIGSARNSVSNWTRTNPASSRPARTFEGDTTSEFAWSVGFGAAWELDRGQKPPVIVEATYRYFDLGTAIGGTAPLPGNGGSQPIEPLQFDHSASVLTLGIRIPLTRY